MKNKRITLEVTLSVVVVASEQLDENSIKGAINAGMDGIVNSECFQCINDDVPESISVWISKLKINKKSVDLGSFGTPELPWGDN